MHNTEWVVEWLYDLTKKKVDKDLLDIEQNKENIEIRIKEILLYINNNMKEDSTKFSEYDDLSQYVISKIKWLKEK